MPSIEKASPTSCGGIVASGAVSSATPQENRPKITENIAPAALDLRTGRAVHEDVTERVRPAAMTLAPAPTSDRRDAKEEER